MDSAEDSLLHFRRFLALKIGLPFVILSSTSAHGGLLFSVGVGVSTGFALLKKNYQLGFLALFFVSSYFVLQSWPFTINHVMLETLILLLIVLDVGPDSSGLSTTQMIKIIIASVWIYSGWQKLVHGYFLSGEFLALETLSGAEGLGRNISYFVRELESYFNTSKFVPIQCCADFQVQVPNWEIDLFRITGISTIVAEVFLPLTLFFSRTRRTGVLLLFLFQLTIGLFSGEMDFAFTATAALFLFLPEYARFTYPSLLLAYLMVLPWI